MTRQEKVNWLSRYRRQKKRVQALELRRFELRQQAENITNHLSFTRGSSGNKSSKIENIIALIDSLDNDIIKEIDTSVRICKEICFAIDAMDDPLEQSLLDLKYIQGFFLHEIAAKLFYSYGSIKNIHSKALDNLEVATISHGDVLK